MEPDFLFLRSASVNQYWLFGLSGAVLNKFFWNSARHFLPTRVNTVGRDNFPWCKGRIEGRGRSGANWGLGLSVVALHCG